MGRGNRFAGGGVHNDSQNGSGYLQKDAVLYRQTDQTQSTAAEADDLFRKASNRCYPKCVYGPLCKKNHRIRKTVSFIILTSSPRREIAIEPDVDRGVTGSLPACSLCPSQTIPISDLCLQVLFGAGKITCPWTSSGDAPTGIICWQR